MPKVAIIMSVYKNDKLQHLDEALGSLYRQTYPVDIFIQQDGEIPQELESLLDDALLDNKICYLGKRKNNMGLAKSLNELLEVVLPHYEYIARMDADDISLENRIEKQLLFMEDNKNIDVVGTYIEEFSEDIEYEKLVQYPLTHEKMFAFFSKRVPLAHVSAFFRKSFFVKAGYYPTESPTNEDTLLWMYGFTAGCYFANIPEVLVRVRVGRAFFSRRGGIAKAWSDLQDRILVINALRYNKQYYFYAFGLFLVNIAPSKLKQFLYKRLR